MAPLRRSRHALHAFVDDLHGLDRHVVALGVEIGRVILAGPRFRYLPARLVRARLVYDDDRDVLALDIAVDDLLVPVVDLLGIGDAPLQRYGAELGQAGELAHVRRIGSLAVVRRLHGGIEAGHFAEPALLDS